jgi:hypothetical protein
MNFPPHSTHTSNKWRDGQGHISREMEMKIKRKRKKMRSNKVISVVVCACVPRIVILAEWMVYGVVQSEVSDCVG